MVSDEEEDEDEEEDKDEDDIDEDDDSDDSSFQPKTHKRAKVTNLWNEYLSF